MSDRHRYEVTDDEGRTVTKGCPSRTDAVADARRRVRASGQRERFRVVSTDPISGHRFTEYRADPYTGTTDEEI